MEQLFNSPPEVLCSGDLIYFADCYSFLQASDLFTALATELNWRQESLQMYGKTVAIPRLQAWYGDSSADYEYSGLKLSPLLWHNRLKNIKAHIECYLSEHKLGLELEYVFNSVLANFYRDNNDGMSWHCDDEVQLGKQPLIASLSLGQARKFSLKHKSSGEKLDLNLQSGSLLLMQGNLQHNWLHCLPKSKKPMTGRINLTFRHIVT